MIKPDFGKIALLPIVLLFSILSINLSHAASYGSISGTVSEASDAPLSGVTVSLIDFTGTNKGTCNTDTSGNYSFAGLSTGLYKVQFSKTGMLTVWNGGATSQQTAMPIELLAPDVITGLNGKLVQGASISGTVRDENNTPLPETHVSIYCSTGSLITYASADTSGNYSVAGLASGRYYILFRNSGMLPVWYGGSATRDGATPLDIVAPNTVTGINSQLGVGGSISGAVTDGTGSPLYGVDVSLFDTAGYVTTGHSYTDESGNYAIKGIGSANYFVQFNSLSSGGMPTVWYAGAATRQEATLVTVSAPEARTGINAQLGVGGSISGTVTYSGSSPLASVQVTLYNSNFKNYLSVITDSSGNYSFKGLATGTYYVSFYAWGMERVWYGGSSGQETAAPILVESPNGRTGINGQLAMIAGGCISGIVTDSVNNPLSGVSVDPYDSQGIRVDGVGATTDSFGNYSLCGLASGVYYIEFYPSSIPGIPPVWYGGTTSQQHAAPISVVAPATTSGINGQLGVGGSISGTVTNASAIPLSGVYAALFDSAGNRFLGVSTDGSGSYSFQGLPSGIYFVSFSVSGNLPVWYGGTASIQSSTPIIVNAPDGTTGINCVLLTGGSIRGTVTDSWYTPFSFVRVALCDPSGNQLYTVNTDSSGNYLINGIAEGTYYLRFSAMGMGPLWYGGSTTIQGATPLDITSASQLSGINGVLGIGGSISGTVHRSMYFDFLVIGARLYDPVGNLVAEANVYGDGSYSFTGLPSGTYYVQFLWDDIWHSLWYGGKTRQTALPVIVTAPDTTTGIDIFIGDSDDSWIDCTIYGSGGGTVTSSPVGIACMKESHADCSVPFAASTTATLTATPDSISVFSGWSGDCRGLSTCSLEMIANRFVNAMFSTAPMAKIGETGYVSLSFAYLAAATFDEIQVLDTVLAEELILTNNKSVTIKGGYKADYGSRSGNHTVLAGSLIVQSGRLTVDGMTIR